MLQREVRANLSTEIIRWLEKQHLSRTAKEIRRAIDVSTTKDVMRVLYELRSRGKVFKDDSVPPRWKCSTELEVESLANFNETRPDIIQAGHNQRQTETDPLQMLAELSAGVGTPPSSSVEATKQCASAKVETPTSNLYKFAQKFGRDLKFDFIGAPAEGIHSTMFTCILLIDGVEYARATCASKKQGKHQVSEQALARLGFNQAEDWRNAEPPEEKEALSELHIYVMKHKATLNWKTVGGDSPLPPFTIAVELDGRMFEPATANSKRAAKRAAAKNALQVLKDRAPDVPPTDPDQIARVAHAQFDELVGAEEALRPSEVLVCFVLVEPAKNLFKVAALSHGVTTPDSSGEHPVYVTRRALVASLYRELCSDDSGRAALLQLKPEEAAGNFVKILEGHEAYLYMSSASNEHAESYVNNIALWSAVGLQDGGLSCYLEPIRLRGVIVGSTPSERVQSLFEKQIARAQKALEQPLEDSEKCYPRLITTKKFSPKMLPEPRKVESIGVKAFWSLHDEDLGLEDADGLDAATGQASSISPVFVLDNVQRLYERRGLSSMQQNRGSEHVRQEKLIINALTSNV
mmetsp:Transcript_5287/g.15803  ORF Transcript_5287/g.15803 Transcript_5287/m.15803 type:complete len:578 (+) Transcript_5287:136-1869(+)